MLTVVDDKRWQWWPLFPLYPYGSKKTICRELIPNQIWSLEQIQGIYYVAVPIRMTVINVSDSLMLINPIPPTKELIKELNKLINKYGPVKTIVLPNSSGLEHKIGLPALSRIFSDAEIWLCPGQWSFPINLPLDFIGIPSNRTKIFFRDGVPFEDICQWKSLGPINLGLGRFQEISCFHKPTGTLNVTDVIVGIDQKPPEIFDFDPTPLLFHSRERGDELLLDTEEFRKKGWARLVLFASFLKPGKLKIPSLKNIVKYSFKKGLRNKKSHFGIYPFLWDEDWELSLSEIMGESGPKIQIAPVIQKLIFPRSKTILCEWIKSVKGYDGLKYLISAHYSSPCDFTEKNCNELIKNIDSEEWGVLNENNQFLSSFYEKLYKIGLIPENVNVIE
tara:strand:+ start:8383 stop:9555 length:1173 start_codon:yes stop_codon:yes gene_type:complete